MSPLKDNGYTVELFNPDTKQWQKADNLCISCVNNCKRKFVPICYDYEQVKFLFTELSNCQDEYAIKCFILKGYKLPKRMKQVKFDDSVKAIIRADSKKDDDGHWNTNDVYAYYGDLQEE